MCVCNVVWVIVSDHNQPRPQVETSGGSFTLPKAVTYASPTLISLSGCDAMSSSLTNLKNCSRTGGDIVTLTGANFGPPSVGFGPPSVLVGGQACQYLSHSHTQIVCQLGAGTTMSNQLLVLQFTGGLFISSLFKVDYSQCPSGFFQNQTLLTCAICPLGTYSINQGVDDSSSTLCSSCKAGEYGITSGASTCVKCGKGTYLPLGSNSTVCVTCAPGKFAAAEGATECEYCPPNTYNHRYAASICTVCPQLSSSSIGAQVCGCRAGFYMDHDVCQPCPTQGALCIATDPDRTRDTLASLPGYWRVPAMQQMTISDNSSLASAPEFIFCPYSFAACPSSANGTCNYGYVLPMSFHVISFSVLCFSLTRSPGSAKFHTTYSLSSMPTHRYYGVLCAICLPGFHQDPTGCSPCENVKIGTALIVASIALLLITLFVFISRRINTRQMVNALKVTVGWLQVMGSTATAYRIPWPASMQGLLANFRLFLFDVFQITAVDCITPFNFYTSFWAVTGVTTGVLVIIPAIHRAVPWVLEVCFPLHDPEASHTIRSLLIKILTMYMTIFYPGAHVHLFLRFISEYAIVTPVMWHLSVPCVVGSLHMFHSFLKVRNICLECVLMWWVFVEFPFPPTLSLSLTHTL